MKNKIPFFLFKRLLFTVTWIMSLSMMSQNISIRGFVSDDKNIPIIGATIILKDDPSKGTITDYNGNFTLSDVPQNATIVVSYVGYKPVELQINSMQRVSIVLLEESELLDEVVVVGYGAQKRITVTGAVATVQTKELKQSPAANMSVALAGRLPGLTALQSSGMPGNDAVNLYLRGMGTVNGADPLILVDGVPRENLNLLDPNEVASISVLKDASSTAVFGVRGANGVIIVTTRQGQVGKPQLSVSSEYGLQSLAARFDRIHSWEYAELRNEASRNSGVSEENLPYTPYMIQKYKDGSDPVFYPDRDIYNDFFHDYTPQTRVNLNYSGASDKIKYFINIGYLNQQGLVKTESPKELGYDPAYKLNRYNFRTNAEYNVLNNLKISVNVASYMEQMNGSAIQGGGINETMLYMMAFAWTMPPLWPGPTTKPGYGVPENQPIEMVNGSEVYGVVNRSGYFTRNTIHFNSSVGLEWGLDFITPGLTTKAMIAYDSNNYSQLEASRTYQAYGAVIARSEQEKSYYTTLRGAGMYDESLRVSDKIGGSRFYMNFQYTLNYARQFGKHNVTGMYLLQRDNWETYTSWDLPYNLFGMSGRVTYNYDQRYMAEFNAGYNGSEQFHKDHRFGFFPAFSAGWVVTNENFLKDNNILSHLKLRASYGKVGNDKLGGDRFLYRTVVQEVGGGTSSQLGLNKRILLGRMGNELLSWEIAEKQNYGIDIQLLNELSISLDLFREERNNVFITRGTVPILQGIPISKLPKVNIGQIDNRGYEIETSWNKSLNNGLMFGIKGNFTYNRNKIVYMDEPLLSEDYAARYRSTGYSIGQFWGYKIDKSNGNGYLNTQEELDWAREAYRIGNPRLGDFKYSDENGDGIIDSKDQVPIGFQHLPRISYGFSGNVAFMGFDFSFLLTGIAQSNIAFNRGINEFTTTGGYYTDIHRNAWTEERYLNGEKITFPALGLLSNVNHVRNELTAPNRSFIKLKNIEIGYNLPSKWLEPIKISSMRIYLNGNNLWTIWTKLPVKTIDPEQTTLEVLPNMKMINLGVNIVF